MIRLGVIGYGGRAAGMVGVLREVGGDVRVVGVVDPDEAGVKARLATSDRQDARFYPNLAELVRGARPDALMIGTRCHQHAPYAIEAAAFDIPLFLEKPVAISMAQAVALEEAFTQSRCPVVVSFPLRVSSLCALARQYLEADAVGSAEHVLATNYVPYGTCYFDMGYRNYAITQGLFLQKATHDFDYLMYLMDSPIVRVAAMQTRGRVFGGTKRAGLVCSACDEADRCLESPANRRRNGSGGILDDHPCVFGEEIGTPESGMNEDSSSALLEFGSGVHGAYTQVFYSRRDAGTRGATISGYAGTLSFDWYTNQLRRVRHHQPFTEVVTAGSGASHFGGDLELMHDFLAVLAGKGTSRTPITVGIQSAYACLAAKESADTGHYVTVRQVGQTAAR